MRQGSEVMAHKRDDEQTQPGPKGPERTCVGSRQARHPREMVRFVLTPQGMDDLRVPIEGEVRDGEATLMMDLSGKAPGRGAWLSPDPDCIKRALEKGGFQRAMRTKLRLPSVPALTQTMTTALLAQLLRRISLARRAGVVVTGQGPVAQALKQGQGKLLLLAGDLSEGGRKKQEANAGRKQLQAVTLPLGGQRLGVCVGRDYAGIILICADPFAEDLQRLSLQVKALGASLSPELQATVGVLPSL
jgi:predicted RNA-binding protein YlxR (DUF448 family)/ribosomal protein L30E